MNCNTIEKKLIFYHQGNLGEEESRQISQHLERCKSCNEKLHYLEQTLVMLDSWKNAEVKPFLFSRIQARANAVKQKPQITSDRWALTAPSMAAVLVLGMILGTLLGKFTVTREVDTKSEVQVAYLFNDTGIENLETKLLNE